MSFNAIQGASIIATHAVATKVLLSFTVRVYQFLQPDPKRRESIESMPVVQRFQKAQMNESEYAGLLVALLFFYHFQGQDEMTTLGSTLAVTGQVGYVWARTFLGYPQIPAIAMALTRYGGLALLCWPLLQLAFATTAE